MKNCILICATTTLALLSAAGLTHGQEIAFAQDQDAAQGPIDADVPAPVDDWCSDCCGGGSGSISATAEILFLRLHVAGGVGSTSSDEFDFDATPRLTLGYTSCDGLGVRARYWDYDEDNFGGIEETAIDTYTLDFEVFQAIDVGCHTRVEFSGGIRHLDYFMDSDLNNENPISFDGNGLVVGLRVERDVCCTTLYGQTRFSVIMGDIFVDDTLGIDHKLDQVEIEFGAARSLCLGSYHVTVNAGVQYSNWTQLADNDLTFGSYTNDVGWAGFILGGTVTY